MKIITVALCASITLVSNACVKQRFKDGMPAQSKPYPTLVLTADKDLAVAAMVRVVLSETPVNSTACVMFQRLKDGFYFLYDADSTLRAATDGSAKVVTGTNCPPTYRHGGMSVGNPPTPPPGYIDPYRVIIEDLEYLPARQAKAKVTADQGGYLMVRYCYAQRISRHNWRAACPRGMNEVLGYMPSKIELAFHQ